MFFFSILSKQESLVSIGEKKCIIFLKKFFAIITFQVFGNYRILWQIFKLSLLRSFKTSSVSLRFLELKAFFNIYLIKFESMTVIKFYGKYIKNVFVWNLLE